MEANGVEHTVTDQGEPVFRRGWLGRASISLISIRKW
jgi:hypothetical protein